jgi:hypothetical protein
MNNNSLKKRSVLITILAATTAMFHVSKDKSGKSEIPQIANGLTGANYGPVYTPPKHFKMTWAGQRRAAKKRRRAA